jgi:hypothetical protein
MCPSRAVGDCNRGPTLWVGRCGGVRTGVDETLRFSGSAVVRLGRTTGAYPVPAMVSILRGGGNGASLATALYGSGLARVVPVMFCAGFAGPHWGLRRGGGFVGCAHSCDFMPPAGGCCQSLVLAVDPCITASGNIEPRGWQWYCPPGHPTNRGSGGSPVFAESGPHGASPGPSPGQAPTRP